MLPELHVVVVANKKLNENVHTPVTVHETVHHVCLLLLLPPRPPRCVKSAVAGTVKSAAAGAGDVSSLQWLAMSSLQWLALSNMQWLALSTPCAVDTMA